ncbi:hypothetical protein OSTOST_11284 [Ostertagia ostertagi]
MLLLLAILPLLQISVDAQVQECHLENSLRKLYEKFMHNANPGLIWNDFMSNQALDEVLVPGSVMKPGAPYLAINGTRTFEKDDKMSLEEKVSKTLGRFLKHYSQVSN